MNKGPVQKLLWLDLEMTGLRSDVDRIIEVACIVTDMDYNELGSYESVINPGVDVDTLLNDFSRQAHTENGLLAKIDTAPSDTDVQQQLISFIDAHFKEHAVLAGNSIHMDRRFIESWWPHVAEKLHYRMVDVSSFKILAESKWGSAYKKGEAHRALGDIRESIAELQHYENLLGVNNDA